MIRCREIQILPIKLLRSRANSLLQSKKSLQETLLLLPRKTLLKKV